MSTLETTISEARRLHARLHRVAFDPGIQGYQALELKQATIEAGALLSLLMDLEVEMSGPLTRQESLL